MHLLICLNCRSSRTQTCAVVSVSETSARVDAAAVLYATDKCVQSTANITSTWAECYRANSTDGVNSATSATCVHPRSQASSSLPAPTSAAAAAGGGGGGTGRVSSSFHRGHHYNHTQQGDCSPLLPATIRCRETCPRNKTPNEDVAETADHIATGV